MNYNYNCNFISELIIEDKPVKRKLLSQEEEINLPILGKNMVEHPKNRSIENYNKYEKSTNKVQKQFGNDAYLSLEETIDSIDEDKVKIQNHHEKEEKDVILIVPVQFDSGRLEAEERIAARMKKIDTLCKERQSVFRSFFKFDLYFFKDFGPGGITWCPVFKAGSSTWRDFFIDHLVDPDVTIKNEHYRLGVLSNFKIPRKRSKYRDNDKDSIRFTIVRHPISRLISHLHKAQNYPYEVKRQRALWTEEAIVNARTNPSWDEETKTKYRQELTKYVDELEPVVDHTPYSKENPYLHPPYPIFVEMVDFIIKHRLPRVDSKGQNGHWNSAVEWCDICHNNFDIIIKLEEEPDELLVLLEKLNMLPYKDDFIKRQNSSSKKSLSEQEILSKYINLLNEKQIKFLDRMYARDFELLGYEPITSHFSKH